MEDIRVVSYEVYVLGSSGWTMHGRFPQEDRRLALTEAKTLEAGMAAATKVIRSEYHPRSNTEQRLEIYSSRLTSGESGQHGSPAPGGAGKRRRHVIHRRDMTPAAVLGHLIGILGASAFLATLITASGGLFFEHIAALHGPDMPEGRGVIYAVFLATLLLVALPWIVSFVRQIEVIGLAVPGPPSNVSKPPAKRPVAKPKRQAGLVDPMATADLPPIPRPTRLVVPEAEEEAAPGEVPAAEEGYGLPESGVVPVLVDPPLDDSPDDCGDLPSGQDHPAPESAERLLKNRRTLLRFLRSLVTDLRESRPNLNSFERYGLGLLLAGAVDQVVDYGGLGPVGRAQLVREALGILGRQPGLIEAVEDGLESTLGDPRSARIIQAGRDSMRHFLFGSRDFLAAVLTALEAWNRPTGATGGGVVAAMLVQAWPGEDAALEAAYAVAQARGGAVIGSVDGIAVLFPGIARALVAALELMPSLPVAARIGIEAAEAATEDEAVRAVGAARQLCHAARPGQILCSSAVRGLGGRVDARFEPVEGPDGGGLPVYSLLAASVGADAIEADGTNLEGPAPNPAEIHPSISEQAQ